MCEWLGNVLIIENVPENFDSRQLFRLIDSHVKTFECNKIVICWIVKTYSKIFQHKYNKYSSISIIFIPTIIIIIIFFINIKMVFSFELIFFEPKFTIKSSNEVFDFSHRLGKKVKHLVIVEILLLFGILENQMK